MTTSDLQTMTAAQINARIEELTTGSFDASPELDALCERAAELAASAPRRLSDLNIFERVALATSITLEEAAAWIAQDSRLVMTDTEAKMRDELCTNDFAVVALNERGTITSAEYRMLFR